MVAEGGTGSAPRRATGEKRGGCGEEGDGSGAGEGEGARGGGEGSGTARGDRGEAARGGGAGPRLP